MKVFFRIEAERLAQVHSDLARPHAFASERVGFIACSVGKLPYGYLLLAHTYLPIANEDYENDPRVGAMMGAGAIRKSLQYAYNQPAAMLHVHRHEHSGTPEFSAIDLRECAKFVPDFWKVRASFPHGAIVLSHDAMIGAWWSPTTKRAHYLDEMVAVGRRIATFRGPQ